MAKPRRCGGLHRPLGAASESGVGSGARKITKSLLFRSKGSWKLILFYVLQPKKLRPGEEGLALVPSHGGIRQFFPWPEDTGHRFCRKTKLPTRKTACANWSGQQVLSPCWKAAGGPHHPGQEVPSLCAGKRCSFKLPAARIPLGDPPVRTPTCLSWWGQPCHGPPSPSST